MQFVSKLSDDVVSKICDGIRLGMTLDAACALAGITSRTLRNWRAAAPESADGTELAALMDRIDTALAEGQKLLLTRMHAHSRGYTQENGQRQPAEGDWKATEWLLESRHRELARTYKTELTGANGGPLALNVARSETEKLRERAGQLTDDEVLSEFRRLADGG